MMPSLTRLLLAAWLALLLAGSVGWRHSSAQENSPPGCEAVFAATTRGGAAASRRGGGLSCSPRVNSGESRVVRVIDGDTVELAGGDRVRYIGIDTLERNEPSYDRATDFNAVLVADRGVRLIKDVSETDRFDRLLRYVYADDILVNAELVSEGWARAVRFKPDVAHAECYAALEREAREAKRGIWAN